MKITLLGTGTSQGVPVLGCQCEVCRSSDSRDKRLRTSALVEIGDTRILIDCGPDFRQQMLRLPFKKLDAVLLTHIHYDHVAGLDDLRPFCWINAVNVFAQQDVVDSLHQTMPYCFPEAGMLYPGAPELYLHTIVAHRSFNVGRVSITPIQVMHGKLPILGFRINRMAYITDMKSMSEAEYSLLEGVEFLIINGLRWDGSHHSHQLIGEAIAFSRHFSDIKEVYITHVTHEVGLHHTAQQLLPEHVHLGYDGEEIVI